MAIDSIEQTMVEFSVLFNQQSQLSANEIERLITEMQKVMLSTKEEEEERNTYMMDTYSELYKEDEPLIKFSNTICEE